MEFTTKELISFVKEQRRIFDVVRLVDVSMTIQYTITEDGGLKPEVYQCYAVWNKNRRCENCISAKAFAIKGKLTKFEFVNNEVYFVVANYAKLEGVPYVIELVSKINDEALFGAYGKNSFIESIEAYNRKIYTDPLTGAYNRQYYNEQLKRLNRFNGIVMLDVDNFKPINDTYGHAVGDDVLKRIVETVMEQIRPSDAIIRLGGDEFLIVFQSIEKNALAERLETIRQAILSIRVQDYPLLRISISMGAVYTVTPTVDLVTLADQSLYEAKETKNSIVLKEI